MTSCWTAYVYSCEVILFKQPILFIPVSRFAVAVSNPMQMSGKGFYGAVLLICPCRNGAYLSKFRNGTSLATVLCQSSRSNQGRSLYITVFYNQVSLHSTLNYLSPYQFEQNTNNLSIEVSDFSWPSHLSNILLCSMEHENFIQQSIQQLLNESH